MVMGDGIKGRRDGGPEGTLSGGSTLYSADPGELQP